MDRGERSILVRRDTRYFRGAKGDITRYFRGAKGDITRYFRRSERRHYALRQLLPYQIDNRLFVGEGADFEL